MRKTKLFIGSLLIMSVLVSCKVNDEAENQSNFESQTDGKIEDYFLPESNSDFEEKNIGEAHVQLIANDFEKGTPIFVGDTDSLLDTSIQAELSGFETNLEVFFYIDSALIMQKMPTNKNIEIPLNTLVTSTTEGLHHISFVQYKDNNEESEVINSVNHNYIIRVH
ncbi:hypothetical protein ACYSNO_02530 [Enterococcus sp. LJL98]